MTLSSFQYLFKSLTYDIKLTTFYLLDVRNKIDLTSFDLMHHLCVSVVRLLTSSLKSRMVSLLGIPGVAIVRILLRTEQTRLHVYR